MTQHNTRPVSLASLAIVLLTLSSACAHGPTASKSSIEPTTRAAELAGDLAPSALKTRLESCANGPFERTEFSIAHRGAPLGYPEHTEEGYIAAAAMGAGIIECDVTFTRDLALVCRHSQCDLHRTTNILQSDLAANCTGAFTPASDGEPANARCCTSDITLAEFRTLCGRRDVVDMRAKSVEEYLRAPATRPANKWANEDVACGTLMTHAESIALFDQLGTAFTPELKSPAVAMPFNGMTQKAYASRMLAEYTAAGIAPQQVWPQSFNIEDVKHWIAAHPQFARQAVYLDPRGRQPEFRATLAGMQELKASGINIVAPPIPMLLTLGESGDLQASDYARYAKQAGLQIITWTLETGNATAPDNWLYASLPGYMDSEAKMLEVLHALHDQVGISGIFSDWPGTVTYYANCFGL